MRKPSKADEPKRKNIIKGGSYLDVLSRIS